MPILRFSLLAMILTSLALFNVQCTKKSQEKEDFPRNETLYLGGIQWGEPTTFNPLMDSASSWPCRMQMSLVYETLFNYNPKSGQMDPLLGESYVMKDDGIEVTLQKEAYWNDGRPFSAWDVIFSFTLGKTYKNVPVASLWDYMSDVKVVSNKPMTMPAADAPLATDYPRTVLFMYKKERKNPLLLLEALQRYQILPRHILETALTKAKGDIQEILKLKLDKNPVTTGPYKLHSYSSEKIITERDDKYWGNKVLHGGKLPSPKYVVHQIYKSNDHYSIGLQQGRLDITSTFIPRIWLKQRKKVSAWFKDDPFYPASSIPMLFINVTKGAPLNNAEFRWAMAAAINYSDIRELAVSGYSAALKPGLILPFGLESKYYFEEDAAKYGAFYNPEKAKALLKKLGYTSVYDKKGNLTAMTDKNGARVPTLFITSPAGWTDWEAIVRIVVSSLRSVGIDAREKFVDGNFYWPSLPKGEFDLIMQTPVPEASPSQPWSRYEFIVSSNGWIPTGEKMWKNYGRYNGPKDPYYIKRFDELLEQIPLLTKEEELIKAYREINALFMQHQPTLPLVYRPEQFYQFSRRNWEGFADDENPYAPPYLPSYRSGTQMLWNLQSATSK